MFDLFPTRLAPVFSGPRANDSKKSILHRIIIVHHKDRLIPMVDDLQSLLLIYCARTTKE
jgi:hypothetical protein